MPRTTNVMKVATRQKYHQNLWPKIIFQNNYVYCSSIYIEGPRTKFFAFYLFIYSFIYLFDCIFTGVLLKTGGLHLNLSIYQICCNAPPEKQEKNVHRRPRSKLFPGIFTDKDTVHNFPAYSVFHGWSKTHKNSIQRTPRWTNPQNTQFSTQNTRLHKSSSCFLLAPNTTLLTYSQKTPQEFCPRSLNIYTTKIKNIAKTQTTID